MIARASVVAVALVFTFAGMCVPALAGGSAPPDAGKAALAFADALVKNDTGGAWQLLSASTRAKLTAAQWQAEFRERGASRMPSGNDLLRALATADEPPTIGDVLIQQGEALVDVSGTVRITYDIILVRQNGRWLVDLPASDQFNSREAARVFIDAVGSASGASSPRPVRTPQTSLPMLRALLAPEAKSFQVLNSSVEGDRATITIASDIPVSLVLRAVRSGPGWVVDLNRPMVNISPTSTDPLKEAVGINVQNTCQEQLRQLGRAIQMYAAAHGDLLPNPEQWVEQIKPYLAEGADVLHCPADKTAGVSYAMNRNLAGKKRSEIGNQPLTPLLFESSLHTANPTDTGESWPAPALHSGGNMVLYVDGNVRAATEKPSFAVTVTLRPVVPGERQAGPGGQPARRRMPPPMQPGQPQPRPQPRPAPAP